MQQPQSAVMNPIILGANSIIQPQLQIPSAQQQQQQQQLPQHQQQQQQQQQQQIINNSLPPSSQPHQVQNSQQNTAVFNANVNPVQVYIYHNINRFIIN